MHRLVLLILGMSLVYCDWSLAATEINDSELRQATQELSASTMVGGEGWQGYDRLLHPEYSRWAMGVVYEGRSKFVKSLEEWWNYGMRVASRDVDIVAVDMVGNLAFVRFITTETFVGPDGPVDGFSGYVSNIWIKEGDRWLLLSAEISAIPPGD